MTSSDGLRIRRAVRAVMLTPAHDILLVRFEFPTRTVWALPGGGLEGEEDHEAALHRELAEEVGVTGATLGPHIWDREHIIPFEDGQWDGQRDRFYLLPVAERFDPEPQIGWEQLRAERLHEIRWWSLDEVRAATGVWFAPRRLGDLLHDLARNGPPTTPIPTGI